MANASPDLLWGIVKDTSCFLMKKKLAGRSGMGKFGAQFTKEANNLKGVNAFKFSGLANTKTVGLSVAADNKGIVLTKKVAKAGLKVRLRVSSEPSSSSAASPPQPPPSQPVLLHWCSPPLTVLPRLAAAVQVVRSPRQRRTSAATKAIKAETEGNYYRADLTGGMPDPLKPRHVHRVVLVPYLPGPHISLVVPRHTCGSPSRFPMDFVEGA